MRPLQCIGDWCILDQPWKLVPEHFRHNFELHLEHHLLLVVVVEVAEVLHWLDQLSNIEKYNRWVIRINKFIILCNFTIFKFCENTWIQDVSMILHWLIESTVKYSKRVKVKTDGEKYTRNLLIYRNKIQNFPVKNYFQIFART